MSISVPSEWKVLVSLFTNKIVQMFSRVVSITVHSVSIIWCKLWQQLDDSYSIVMLKAALLMYAIYPFKSTTFTHYCMWDIDWKRQQCLFKMFELLRIWSISQYLAAPFSHCKPWLRTWSTIVALISSICASVLGLFLCFVSVHVHTSLLFFLSAVDPDRFSEFVTLMLFSVYMLSNWRFTRCTFELFQRFGF